MKPFRTSLTARIVSVSIAVTLAGTGVAALLSSIALLPYCIILGVSGCFIGVIAGALEQTAAAAFLSVTLPMLLWPYVMVAELAIRRAPVMGWAFIAAGALMAAQTAIAGVVKERKHELAPAGVH
jgi:hypothetical protein